MNKNNPLLAIIVGMSRGGTTWMSSCLSRHSNLAVFGESLYFGRRYLQPEYDGKYSSDQIEDIKNRLKIKGILRHGVGNFQNLTQDNVGQILDIALPGRERLNPGQVFHRICSAIAKKENKPWVIEKTPHHINSIELILKFFPRLNIIAMSREPYGFMLSYKHQLDRQRIDPGQKASRQKMYHPIGCALVWRRYANRIEQIQQKYPNQIFCVDLSEIKSDPDKVLEDVQKFLKLPIEKTLELPQVNTSFPLGKRPELKNSDYFWLSLIAGKILKKYPKPKERKSKEILSVIKSVIAIPFWALTVIKNMEKETNGNVLAYLFNWIFNSNK